MIRDTRTALLNWPNNVDVFSCHILTLEHIQKQQQHLLHKEKKGEYINIKEEREKTIL